MSEQQLQIIQLQNKTHQLQQLLEVERVKNFTLRRLLCEIRFQIRPLWNKLDKIRDFKE